MKTCRVTLLSLPWGRTGVEPSAPWEWVVSAVLTLSGRYQNRSGMVTGAGEGGEEDTERKTEHNFSSS